MKVFLLLCFGALQAFGADAFDGNLIPWRWSPPPEEGTNGAIGNFTYLTNNFGRPNTVAIHGAGKLITSVLNGGDGTYLEGTTPPSYSTPAGTLRNWSGTTGNNLTPANTTIYYALNGNSITNLFTSDTTCVTRSLMTRTTTLQNLYVQLSAGPGGARVTSITVMTNGVASPIVATVQGANTTGNDTVNTVTVAAGVEVGIRISTVASATTAKISWALEGR